MQPVSSKAPLRAFIFGMWLVTAALSLYAASDIRSWVLGSPVLSERTRLVQLAAELASVSERTGLPELRERFEGLVRPPVDRYVVLQKPPREEPTSSAVAVTTSPASSALDGKDDSPSTSSLPKPLGSVLFIGASSIQHHLGIELERLFGAFYEGLDVTRFGKLSTGLARPDVFDWPKRAHELAAEYEPELVVANFGGNDAQSMLVGKTVLKFGTKAWDDEYARRVRALIDAAGSRGAKVAIIGMPLVRSAKSSARIRHVNDVTERATREASATFIHSWDIAADEHGGYREAVEVNGERGPMRMPDGWHYTRLGGQYVAERLAERIEWRFPLVPKDPSLAVAIPRQLTSRALGGTASYVAYVPKAAGPNSRFPVLFLLHGATGSWRDWPAHAHRSLQRLSQANGIVIVTPEGGEQGWYVDSPLLPHSQYATHLLDEVLPDVTANFPVTTLRAIAGLSAGGHGAITLALQHPGTFVSASSMSGVLDLTAAAERQALIDRLGPYQHHRERWEARSALHLVTRFADRARALPLLVTVGASDKWAATNRHFHDKLTELGVDHVFDESPGGHDWKYWTEQLPKHVEWHVKQLRARAEPVEPPSPK